MLTINKKTKHIIVNKDIFVSLDKESFRVKALNLIIETVLFNPVEVLGNTNPTDRSVHFNILIVSLYKLTIANDIEKLEYLTKQFLYMALEKCSFTKRTGLDLSNFDLNDFHHIWYKPRTRKLIREDFKNKDIFKFFLYPDYLYTLGTIQEIILYLYLVDIKSKKALHVFKEDGRFEKYANLYNLINKFANTNDLLYEYAKRLDQV